jgi:hypothetical protein
MMVMPLYSADLNWRELEPGFEEVIRAYPGVSPFIVLKIDVQRRGAKMTRQAREALDPKKDSLFYRGINLENKGQVPNGLLLRDGTSIPCTILTDGAETDGRRLDPYVLDSEDGKFLLKDEGKTVDEVALWPSPRFTGKKTSKGTPMWQVLIARPQRMDVNLYQTCDFWKEGTNCKFCVAGVVYHGAENEKSEFADLDDIEESVAEALKQPGRFRMISLCSGTLLSGRSPQDDEVNLYIDILRRIGKYFDGEKVMTQLVATAFSERQLRRLHDETILRAYTADLEVLDEEVFNWVCPGKAKHIGYREWKNRLYSAVDIFGPGTVTTGVVSGVETAQPRGFKTEKEALEKCLAETEELARHGVGVAQTIYHAEPGAAFFKQKTASLNYLVAFAEGVDRIARRHGLDYRCDDYRTCGNHPTTDMARTWHWK